MNKICLIILVLYFINLQAQEHKSIHQYEREVYSINNDNQNSNSPKGTILNITPLNKNLLNKLNKVVFGYLPDWEYKTAKNYLRYDLLTHIAAFDFPVSSTGNFGIPSGWPWTDILNSAHANGVKVVMAVTNFNKDQLKLLLSDTTARNKFYTNAKNTILIYNLDGINIDFEAPYTADRGAPMNKFVKGLTDYLHAEIPETEVSFAGPAINWSGWDLVGLANSCDYIFIMGYDFYGSWSETTGPSSPLSGGANNINTTITSTSKGYGNVIATKPEKLILGVPYYGNKWTSETSSALSKVISYKNSTRFKDDVVNANTYGRIWESTYQVPWYKYQQNFEWYQIWYDDQQSLGLKYDMAISKKMKGVGMWALGYDGARTELWDLLEEKFKSPVSVEREGSDINEYYLGQNYPNPFNPSTIINYKVANEGAASIKIYDMLGKEISTIVDKWHAPGIHEVEFSAQDLAGGIYMYRLLSGGQLLTKKMMILK